MNTENIRWPAFIVCLVVSFCLFSWWTMNRAISGVSPVSDPNYYSHGLKYNNTSIEIQTAQALSWTITPKVKGRVLTVQVVDAQESAVSGLQGSVAAQFEGARQGPLSELSLSDNGQGLYAVTLPSSLPRTFSANLTMKKDQATVNRRLLINLDE
ncbi:MAG: FixH family protein [Desulfobulbaceae bacterium]|nr:FixH family protein [Desulfobulbaceae bacterium]